MPKKMPTPTAQETVLAICNTEIARKGKPSPLLPNIEKISNRVVEQVIPMKEGIRVVPMPCNPLNSLSKDDTVPVIVGGGRG